MRRLDAMLGLALAVAGAASSCDRGPGGPEQPAWGPSGPVAPDLQEAQQIFSSRCQTCHGLRGQGNGPAAPGISPPPRDFTDPAWQDAVTDQHIEQIVVQGGAAVGLSPAMPNNPDLRGRPAVVAGLRQIVRSFRRAQ